MTFRRFTLTKIASVISVGAPLVISKPVILTALEGSTVLYLGASFVGNGASIVLTELIDYRGTVVASSPSDTVTYTAKFDEYYKLRQTISSPGGTVTTISYEVGTTPVNTDWDIPSPVVRDTSVYSLTDVNQPGSRLHYISYSSGVAPADVVYYFWNGTNIVDKFGSTTGAGGVPYGTDPMNPTGPVIASKYWCAVGPTRQWSEVGIRTGDGVFKKVGPTQFYFGSAHRHTKPDWFLFKRGDTFNLKTDKTEYATYATSWTANYAKLTLNGGLSVAGRQVMGAYGPVTTDLPKIVQPSESSGADSIWERSDNAVCSNILITDLEFNNRVRNASDVYYSYFMNVNGSHVDSKNMKVQGCRFIAMGTGDPNTGSTPRGRMKIEFFRCVAVDAYSGPKFGNNISACHQGGEVQQTSHAWFNQCLVARNGYNCFDPATIEASGASFPAWSQSTAYPFGSKVTYTNGEVYMCLNDIPSGTAFVDAGDAKFASTIGTGWKRISDYGGKMARGTGYDRNFYMDGPASLTDSVCLRGASGEQFRNGGIDFSRNYMMLGYLSIGSDFLIGTNDNYSLKCYDTVIELFYQTGIHLNQGVHLNLGARNGDFKRLLVTSANPQAAFGGTLSGFGVGIDCFGWTWEDVSNVQWNRTSNNKFQDCIIDGGNQSAVYVSDGIKSSTSFAQSQLPMPSVVGNSFTNCKFVSTNTVPLKYDPRYNGPATTDTAYVNCTTYNSRSAAATANSWTGTDRTLKTYLQSQGITVNSIDGVHEYVGLVSTMHRGNWAANEKWTAKPIINYVRAGWGMATLA